MGKLVNNLKNSTIHIRIGIIGKYFDIGDFELPDAYISVIEAVKHACAALKVKPLLNFINSKILENNKKEINKLKNIDGIIVPGGFGSIETIGKIKAIEFARNVCNLKNANSTEIDENTPHPIIDLLPWQKELLKEKKYGATMRLGGQIVKIKKGTLAYKLYSKEEVIERFRHRYEVNPKYVEILEKNGFIFSGTSKEEENIMQIGEIPSHKFFIGTQFHPEFSSKFLDPHPIFIGFIKNCIN